MKKIKNSEMKFKLSNFNLVDLYSLNILQTKPISFWFIKNITLEAIISLNFVLGRFLS